MTNFPGFPARARATAIPRVLFTDLLPALADDPAAVGVALYAIDTLQARRGFPRWLTLADLAANDALLRYLRAAVGHEAPANVRAIDGDAADVQLRDAIGRGLVRTIEAGVLLALPLERDDVRGELYFLNTPADRRGLEAVRTGAVDIDPRVLRDAAPTPAGAPPARSNVFSLYEQLIGTISPLIADELAEAERLYPAEWLEAAFREAAAQNARSWRYVSRILERWAIEGPDHATTERDPAAGGERYFHGKYGRILRQRLNG
jgi:DNA replication protein